MPLANLSRHQYGALREIRSKNITVAYLRNVRDVTIWSLFHRGYLGKTGRGDDAVITLTTEGEEAFRQYHSSSLPLRQNEAELTERLQRYLSGSRLVEMRKTG